MVVWANEGTGTTNSAVSCRMERGRVWLVGLKSILEDFSQDLLARGLITELITNLIAITKT